MRKAPFLLTCIVTNSSPVQIPFYSVQEFGMVSHKLVKGLGDKPLARYLVSNKDDKVI